MAKPATMTKATTSAATNPMRLRLIALLLEVVAGRGCFRRSQAVPFGIVESATQSSARRLRCELARKRLAPAQAMGARPARQHAAGQSLLRRETRANAALPRAALPRGAGQSCPRASTWPPKRQEPRRRPPRQPLA